MNERTKRMADAIGAVDDIFIEMSAPAAKKRADNKRGKLAAAICAAAGAAAAIALCIAAFGSGIFGGVPVQSAGDINADDSQQENIAQEPHWEDMAINERYNTVKYGGYEYNTRGAISGADIAQKLADVTACGFDMYSDEVKSISAEIYAITGISEKCAAAVKYEGDDGCYVITNAYYQPASLGDFINDLSLNENLSFGKAEFSCTEGSRRVTYHYDGLDGDAIKRFLMQNADIKAEKDPDALLPAARVLSISISAERLGYKNISMWLREDGYLVTNLLDTAKAFYIGGEKSAELIGLVRENAVLTGNSGYEIPADGDGDGANDTSFEGNIAE